MNFENKKQTSKTNNSWNSIITFKNCIDTVGRKTCCVLKTLWVYRVFDHHAQKKHRNSYGVWARWSKTLWSLRWQYIFFLPYALLHLLSLTASWQGRPPVHWRGGQNHKHPRCTKNVRARRRAPQIRPSFRSQIQGGLLQSKKGSI